MIVNPSAGVNGRCDRALRHRRIPSSSSLRGLDSCAGVGEDQDGEIVGLWTTGAEVVDCLEERLQQGHWRQFLDGRRGEDALFAEFLAVEVARFGDAVAERDQDVTRFELDRLPSNVTSLIIPTTIPPSSRRCTLLLISKAGLCPPLQYVKPPSGRALRTRRSQTGSQFRDAPARRWPPRIWVAGGPQR